MPDGDDDSSRIHQVAESPHDALIAGARLFDRARFFEAHEAWEQHWRAESDPERRRFLQGMIQIAAALHKLLNLGAADSASRLFSRGMAKLDACPALIAEHHLEDFCAAVRAYAQAARRVRSARPPLPTLGGRG